MNARKRYANQHGLAVAVDHVITDPCSSGPTRNRPGLDRVQAVMEARKVDAVIVSTQNWLSRRAAYLLSLREEWQRIGITLHYVNR